MEQEQPRSGTPATEAMGAALRGVMGEKNVSVPDLAKASGIPFGTLRRYTQGLKSPNSDQLILIADALGVRWAELIGRADDILLRESGGTYPKEALRHRQKSIEPGATPGLTASRAELLSRIANGEESSDDTR